MLEAGAQLCHLLKNDTTACTSQFKLEIVLSHSNAYIKASNSLLMADYLWQLFLLKHETPGQ